LKTKRLAIILSVFAAVVLIVVLCSTVFTITNIELKFYNTPVKLNTLTKDTVAAHARFNYSESVFLASKKEYTKNIEEKLPYAKVVAIETVFPNTLRVCVIERQEVFVLKKAGGYIVCDSDFKVLRTGAGTFSSVWNNPILIESKTNVSDSFIPGMFLSPAAMPEIDRLKDLEGAFYQHELDVPDLLALVKSVRIAGNNLLLTTHDGVEILIHESAGRLVDKVGMAVAVLEGLSSAQRVKGVIAVFTAAGGEVTGTYLDI